MSKTIKDSSWSKVKIIAWQNQGGVCPICGRYIDPKAKRDSALTGHHIVNRSKGGKSTIENCEVRHCRCEAEAHRKYRDGNPPKEFGVGFFFRRPQPKSAYH